jgi:hypothetical protein
MWDASTDTRKWANTNLATNKYKSPVSENRNQQANEAPADKPKKHFWSDWEPIAWFNFVIAVCAVVSALVSAHSSWRRRGSRPNFTWPVQGRTRPTLLPPQHLTVGAEPISQSQLDTVTSRKQTLLVYGDVTYQDIFGKWYKTEYCFQFYNAVRKSDGTVAFQFFYCPTHNCADEDCPS